MSTTPPAAPEEPTLFCGQLIGTTFDMTTNQLVLTFNEGFPPDCDDPAGWRSTKTFEFRVPADLTVHPMEGAA